MLASGVGPAGSAWGIDPRIRLLAVVSFAVAVVSLDGWRSLFAAIVVAVFAMIMVRPDWRAVARQILAMDGLMLTVLASLPFSVPGEPLGNGAGSRRRAMGCCRGSPSPPRRMPSCYWRSRCCGRCRP